MIELQPWVKAILAHPVTKQPCEPDLFDSVKGVIDARVFLKNTHGYSEWAEGQNEYEDLAGKETTAIVGYQAEIEYDRPIYQHYQMAGRILDCGGGQALCGNIYRMMWSLFQPILGCMHLLKVVRLARLRIAA